MCVVRDEVGLQLSLLNKNCLTLAFGKASDKEVYWFGLSKGVLIEISALANELGTDKYTQCFWLHPLLLVRRAFPFGVNIGDKNKALQIIITPFINAVEALGMY